MSARLRRAGYRIGYSPNALAHHEVDPARAIAHALFALRASAGDAV